MTDVTIKKLYNREKVYAGNPDYYTPERIKAARNDDYTNGIVNSMHENLLDLSAEVSQLPRLLRGLCSGVEQGTKGLWPLELVSLATGWTQESGKACLLPGNKLK